MRRHIFLTKEFWLVSMLIVLSIVLINANFLITEMYDGPKLFVGTVDVAKGDKAVYISMIEQVRQGNILVDNLYTSEIQAIGLFHPLWIGLGKTAQFLHLSSIQIFFYSKIVLGILLLYGVYALARQWWAESVYRVLAVVGVAWFGGWGQIAISFVRPALMNGDRFFTLVPIDLWYSEAFGFLTLSHSPLFIISQLLMVAAWWYVREAMRQDSWWYAIGVAVSIGLVGIMHPFDAIGWWVVTGIWMLIELTQGARFKTIVAKVSPAFVISAVVGAYFLYLLINEPILGGWHAQNIMHPPSWYSLFVGVGWMWLLGGLGFCGLHTNQNKKILQQDKSWLLAWTAGLLLLIFIPLEVSRRLISGWGIGVVLVSVFGIEYWWRKWGRNQWRRSKLFPWQFGLAGIIGLMLMVTPLYAVGRSMYEIRQYDFPEFRSSDTREVLEALAHTESGAVIMAEPFLANIIPSMTARKVWVGHDVQTLHYDDKLQLQQQLYTSGQQVWKQQFVVEQGIDYVVWPAEQEITTTWPVVLSNAEYVVYYTGNR